MSTSVYMPATVVMVPSMVIRILSEIVKWAKGPTSRAEAITINIATVDQMLRNQNIRHVMSLFIVSCSLILSHVVSIGVVFSWLNHYYIYQQVIYKGW